MKIDKAEIEGSYVVKLSGEISFREKESVKIEFISIAEKMKQAGIKNMLIDASDMNYIDSSEIGFFVNLKKNLNTDGIDMRFVNVSREIMTVLKLLSLEKILCR